MKKLTYEFVRDYFKDCGCKLLSEEYVGCELKLKYIAKCGHEHSMSLSVFKAGHGRMCPKCVIKELGEKRRLSYEEVKKTFKESGCKLLSDEYVGSKSHLKYIAQCGHENLIFLYTFKSGHGRICLRCAKKEGGNKQKLLYKDVKYYFKQNDCELLSEDYICSHSKLKYVAKCGHENSISLAGFKSGHGRACRKCVISRSGKDHPSWNPNLTSEDRIKGRFTRDNIVWRKGVYERDDYTCQITGEKGGKLVAHHMKPYHKHKDLRFEISNGITLSKKFHVFAHKTFGYKAEIGHEELIKVKKLWDKKQN